MDSKLQNLKQRAAAMFYAGKSEQEIDQFLSDNGASAKQLKMLPKPAPMTQQQALAALKNPNLLNYDKMSLDPTNGMSKAELVAAGAGKAVMDKVRGAGQMLGVNSQQDITDAKNLDAPLMNTKEGKAGNSIGELATAALIPYKNLETPIAAGGLLGAMTPTNPGDSRLKNTATGIVGGAAGYGVGKGLGYAVAGKSTPPMSTMDDVNRATAVDFLGKNDIPTSYSETMGKPWSKNLERMLQNLPGSAGFYHQLRGDQQHGINNVVQNMTGGDVGSQYNTFGQGKNIKLDNVFFKDLANIPQNFGGVAQIDLPTSALKAAENYVGSKVPNPAIAGMAPNARASAIAQGVPEYIVTKKPVFNEGQTIPFSGPLGDFNNFSALRSLYGKRAYEAGDPVDQAAYSKMRDAFDSMAARQYPDEAGNLADLKSKYFVEKSLAPALSENGDYSLPKIAGIVQRKDTESKSILDNLTGGRGDTLRNLAQAEPFVKPARSSGTAENILWQKIATGGMLGGGGAAGLLASGGDPMSGLAGAAGGAATLGGAMYAFPWLLNKLLQSRIAGNPALEKAITQALTAPGVAGPRLLQQSPANQ
jgi:hypothetical protein